MYLLPHTIELTSVLSCLNMSTISKLTSKVSTFLPTRNGWIRTPRPRLFVTASRPGLSESKKEKEALEACQNVKEAADAVKEGAKAVKKTSEYVREVAASTADNVNKMTKEVTDKAKDIVTEAAKATTEVIKNKIVNK